jgi:capsular exopolysaccharide synthesis family protein
MPTLPALLVNLGRRKLLAATLALVLAPLAFAVVWHFMPENRHMVQAMVHLSSVQESVLGSNAQDNEARFAYFQKTQMTLVKTQLVIDAALRDPAVRALKTVQNWGDPRTTLRDQIKVDFTQGPEILRITMHGDRAADLVVLVNAVMKAYLEEFVHAEGRRRASRLAHLEEMLADHSRSLREKRLKLAASMGNTAGPASKDGVPTEKMREAELASQKLHAIQAEIERLELKLSEQPLRKQAGAKVLVPPMDVEAELAKDTVIQLHQNRLAALGAQETELRAKYHDAFAQEQMRKLGLADELASTRRELEQRLTTQREEIMQRLYQQKLASIDAETALLGHQLRIAREQQERTLAAIKSLGDVGKETFQMGLLAKESEDEELLVKAIQKDIREVQLQELAPARVKPLDQAVVTNLGPSRKKMLAAAGAGFLMLSLVCLGVGWWEFNQRKVGSVDEVVHGFGVPLVGTLPRLPRSQRHDPAGRLAPNPSTWARWTEALDAFRLMLDEAAPPRPLALMVASAAAGEGKTSLAAHLALSYARTGARTLLIDGDLRKPSLHALLGTKSGPGLAGVLREAVPLNAAIQPTAQPGLSLLPAGEVPPAVLDGDLTAEMAKLYLQLRQHFAVIVVDSSPLLEVAAPLAIARHMDGIVVSLLRGVTRMPKLSAALHRLKMLGTPILGAVLHGTDEEVYGTSYLTPAEATLPR